MEEKKKIKISLETAVCITIIISLVIAIGIVYYSGLVKKKELEADNIELNKQITSLKSENENLSKKISELEGKGNNTNHEEEQEKITQQEKEIVNVKEDERVETMKTENNVNDVIDEICKTLYKNENKQIEINSLTIYTNDIEKKKDIPEKFDNENTIYRRT